MHDVSFRELSSQMRGFRQLFIYNEFNLKALISIHSHSNQQTQKGLTVNAKKSTDVPLE